MFFDLPLEQLLDYRPPRTEPADFDDFWATTLAEARRDLLQQVDADPAMPSGLLYEAGMDVDLGGVSDGEATIYSFTGGLRYKDGDIWGHQRLYRGLDQAAFDYTFSDFYELNASGMYEDFFDFRNMFVSDGKIRLGFGQLTYLGLHIGLRAAALTRDGKLPRPTAVFNTANTTPSTHGTYP